MSLSDFLNYLKDRVAHYEAHFGLNTGQAFAMWYATENRACVILS